MQLHINLKTEGKFYDRFKMFGIVLPQYLRPSLLFEHCADRRLFGLHIGRDKLRLFYAQELFHD